jgi:hypothetical protein
LLQGQATTFRRRCRDGARARHNHRHAEALVERSGLTPTTDGYIEITLDYADDQALLRGNRANGPVVLAERTSREAAVIDALRSAFDRFRTASGAYRIETEWRHVIATI